MNKGNTGNGKKQKEYVLCKYRGFKKLRKITGKVTSRVWKESMELTWVGECYFLLYIFFRTNFTYLHTHFCIKIKLKFQKPRN